METPKRPSQAKCNNNDNDDAGNPSSPKTPPRKTPSSKAMDSPRTPVQRFNDSLEDEDTDEMGSPSYHHIIPMHHRDDTDNDMDDVRIGWDDGFGSVFYRDDDCRPYRRHRRSVSGRRHQSLFNPFSYDSETTTPSPKQCPTVNLALINAELNDYLGCILSCLSAKKRDRQLMKLKNETSSTNTNSTESSIESSLFNDSADDEMMMLCSQAVEKSIAADTNCNNQNAASSKKTNSLSIVGISPLKNTNNTMNNNVYHHAAKKFKPIHLNFTDDKKNENLPFSCHTLTTNTGKKSLNFTTNSSTSASYTVIKSEKEDYSSTFNDSTASDDDLFSAIDLSAIEQQISSCDEKTTSAQQKNKVSNKEQRPNICVWPGNKPTCSTSTNNNPSSLLWRRSSSSSAIVNKQLQQPTDVIGPINSKPSHSGTTTKRYCTPAEIEAKRERARRTLMLKFKSKNKSAA